MDPVSVESSFSLSPSLPGHFEWLNENRTLNFIPATSLDISSSYSGRLLGTAKDADGRLLDGNFVFGASSKYNPVIRGTEYGLQIHTTRLSVLVDQISKMRKETWRAFRRISVFRPTDINDMFMASCLLIPGWKFVWMSNLSYVRT